MNAYSRWQQGGLVVFVYYRDFQKVYEGAFTLQIEELIIYFGLLTDQTGSKLPLIFMNHFI